MVAIYINNYLREVIGSREQKMALGPRMLTLGLHYPAVSDVVLVTGIARIGLCSCCP
jgi:hypothetical protein